MPALDGQSVVVTGASSGIGRAIALRSAAEGAAVLAVGRDERALAETVAGYPERIVPFRADLGEPDATAAVVAAAEEALGGLDGLVHSAGTVWRGEDIRESTDEQLSSFIELNLTSALRLSRDTLRVMTAHGGGSIVLVGSQLAHVGVPGYPTYSAAKGGVTAMARALAVDAGPAGVRVNVLAPGVVKTPMAYVDRPDFDSQEEAIAQRHPLRRIGLPEDMAGPAVFLLSDDSAWMTGQTLIVDGGFTIT